MLSTNHANGLNNGSLRGIRTDHAIVDLQQQIRLLDGEITSLRFKTQKKLDKLEQERLQTNLLIKSGIGSKADKADLRQTKRQLRERRILLWEKLERLPVLEEERRELAIQLEAMRRRYGVLDSSHEMRAATEFFLAFSK